MLEKILTRVKAFLFPTDQSDLEVYLKSKNPQSAAEVEMWIREYDNERAIICKLIANGEYSRAYWFRTYLS